MRSVGPLRRYEQLARLPFRQASGSVKEPWPAVCVAATRGLAWGMETADPAPWDGLTECSHWSTECAPGGVGAGVMQSCTVSRMLCCGCPG